MQVRYSRGRLGRLFISLGSLGRLFISLGSLGDLEDFSLEDF
jgi:hypothetical protein